MEIEDFKKQLKVKEDLIDTLQGAIKLKDDQINTLKESIELKNEQIKTLEQSLDIKGEKIDTLQQTLKLKNDQLETSSAAVDESVLIEKEKEIEELKKQVEILNSELVKADEDLANLEQELDSAQSGGGTSNSLILDFTNAEISKSQIIEHMREILQKALHNVMMAIPRISDLQDLYLYEVRSSVNMKISCLINPGIEEHSDLLEEFESLDNISLRTYEGEDRYVIIRDGEELFFAVVGDNESNHLVFRTRDPSHIRFFNALVMESWLRGRKI